MYTFLNFSVYNLTKLAASEISLASATFNKVAVEGERIEITQSNGESIFLVSKEDLILLASCY